MGWQLLEAACGVLVVAATLLDVFLTIIVPGRIGVGPRTAALVRRLFLPLWIWVGRRAGERYHHGILGAFPGVLLVSVFFIWLVLMLVGLSLIAHALAADFQPPLSSIAETTYQVGSAMMTLGLSGHTAQGWGRAVPVLAGVFGLQVVTLTLTYILQLQSALQRRDPLVMILATIAGTPPSGLQLLLTASELGLRNKLDQFFKQWTDWAGDLLHAYSARPVLVYFRSRDRDANWLSSLGAVLDASVLLNFVEGGERGEAQLFYRAGVRLAELLCDMLGAVPLPHQPSERDRWDAQFAALTEAGYPVGAPGGRDAQAERMHAAYQGHLRAIGRYLDLPTAAAMA